MENNKKSLGAFLSEYAAYIALIVLAVVLAIEGIITLAKKKQPQA